MPVPANATCFSTQPAQHTIQTSITSTTQHKQQTPQPQPTTMTAKENTLDDLSDELKTIINQNSTLLQTIESHKSTAVVSDYTYSLHFDKKDGGDETWSLTSKHHRKDVSRHLDDWRYKGEALKVPDDIFNDGINYTLTTYADVIYLNDEILKIGNKVSEHLIDCPKHTDILSILVENAKCLHAAIQELSELTVDAKNPFSKSMILDMMKSSALQDTHQSTTEVSTYTNDQSSNIQSVQSKKILQISPPW
eukprot:7485715-Ditylum_brightwellii.AAC.1